VLEHDAALESYLDTAYRAQHNITSVMPARHAHIRRCESPDTFERWVNKVKGYVHHEEHLLWLL
jgi:hypothetical protein